MAPSDTLNYVKLITITPLYPVLDENDNSPGFRLDLPLYDSANPEAKTPCTIDMTSDVSRQIRFHLEIPKDGEFSFTVEAQLAGEMIIVPDSAKPGAEHKTFTVDLKDQRIKNQTETLPWGIKGQVTWNIAYTLDKQTFSHSLSHHLEIYAVSPFDGSEITRGIFTRGLPRTALEFYVLRSRELASEANIQVVGIKEYAATIVSAVFSGAGFSYDTSYGQANYTNSGRNTYFNVNRWARRITAEKVPPAKAYHVNCYDQAAAVFTGITLALTNLENYKRLVWHYALPFGFIEKVALVGWGETNSPYFKGNQSNQIIPAAADGTYPDTRTAFWNHAFLSFDGHALDATCGPHVGNETIDKYLSKGIDYETGKISNNQGWADDIKDPDTSESERDQARAVGGATASSIDARPTVGLTSLDPLAIPHHVPITEKTLGVWFSEKNMPEDFKKTWGITNEKLEALEEELVKKLVEGGFHDPSAGRLETDLVKFLQTDKTHISWEAHVPTGNFMIDIHVCANFQAASAEFVKDTIVPTQNPASNFVVPQEPKAPYHLVGNQPGRGYHIFWIHNLFVKVSGLNDSDELAPFAQLVLDHLEKLDLSSENVIGNMTIMVLGEEHAADEQKYQCKVGDLVIVEVECQNSKGLSVESYKSGELLFPTNVIQKPNAATFHILACKAGDETLTFVARDLTWNTAKRSTVTFTIEGIDAPK
ncbi:hypothetical protein BDV93DRAFT_562934 [Ceratobasidium sp. AG-I]|nr:hypothetical protein BDV93DRAFT_562934 [Ceratobasidium sp. AG-I]